jgi:hypothetical protein
MSVGKLYKHVLYLCLSVNGLPDPPPGDAIELFNRLLAEARPRCGTASLVHEIPELGSDARRVDLLLWTNQLMVALER